MNNFDFLPIDVQLNYDKQKLVSFFHQYAQKAPTWWNIVVIREPVDSNSLIPNYHTLDAVKFKWNPDCEWAWMPEFEEQFPLLINDLNEKLPYSKITNVMLMSNYTVVHPHNDISNYDPEVDNVQNARIVLGGDMEPSSYRVLIDGSLDDTFFLSDPNVGEESGRKWLELDPTPGVDYNYKTVRMPEDTNVMVFPTFSITHGALIPESPKIILSIHGFLDKDRHNELLQKSYERYKDYAVSYFE